MLLTCQRRGMMKGMGKVVEWSQRDETIHVEGIAALFRMIAADFPEAVTDALKKDIYDLVRETVRLEDAFVDLAFGLHKIEGLTPEEVKQYVRFIADRRLTQLGLRENWGIHDNPLPWVDHIVAGVDHTNFFEGKVTEYDTAGLTGEWGYGGGAEVAKYKVYTKSGCPYCTKVKALLAGGAVPFEVIDLSDDQARKAFYAHRGFAGVAGPYGATMPKVYEVLTSGHEALVGGYTELARKLGRDA
jgi:ribonucleoside-diphosphate reductase beta chain